MRLQRVKTHLCISAKCAFCKMVFECLKSGEELNLAGKRAGIVAVRSYGLSTTTQFFNQHNVA